MAVILPDIEGSRTAHHLTSFSEGDRANELEFTRNVKGKVCTPRDSYQ